jgi:hypothetical protein
VDAEAEAEAGDEDRSYDSNDYFDVAGYTSSNEVA